jgi:PA-IL-like protein
MSIDPRLVRGAIALLVIVVLSVVALADTIRLKDGSIIKGKIASFGAGKFVVVIGEGSRKREMTFNASEVESITFDQAVDASQPSETTRKASYEPPAKTEPVSPKVVMKEPEPAPSATARSRDTIKPIEWRIKVLGDNTANGWTNTGWVVKKGQRIRIEGDGTISLGRNQRSSPSGVPDLEDQQKLLKSVATGALIAVIGDDNNDFIYIGASREFVATRDGALFLGINEGHLDDNSGYYDVKVVIIPDGE